MEDIQEEIVTLIRLARTVHRQRQDLNLSSIDLVAELWEGKAAAVLGVSNEKLAELLGLTINKYWKRVQVARTMKFFPEIRRMLQKNELKLSHVVIIAPKITQRNKDFVLEKVKNKSKRAIEWFFKTLPNQKARSGRRPRLSFPGERALGEGSDGSTFFEH